MWPFFSWPTVCLGDPIPPYIHIETSTNIQIRAGVRGRLRLVRGAESVEQLFLLRFGSSAIRHPKGLGGMQKSQRLPNCRENLRGFEAQGGEQGAVPGLLGRVEGDKTGVGH